MDYGPYFPSIRGDVDGRGRTHGSRCCRPARPCTSINHPGRVLREESCQHRGRSGAGISWVVTDHSPEYRRYLKSPEWAHRKSRYYAIHHRRCAACGTWKKIHLHHATYERLTREPDSDLWPLCLRCHRNVHAAARSGKYRDLEAATIAIVKMGEARRWRREHYRRMWRWLIFRVLWRRPSGVSQRHRSSVGTNVPR